MTARDHTWGTPTDEGTERWIREQVEAVLGRDGAEEWMNRPNAHLDDSSPQQVLDAGEVDRLRGYVSSLLDGAYL